MQVKAMQSLWSLPVLCLVAGSSVLTSEAIVVRAKPRSGISLLGTKQVPGPLPLYVEYGPPEFTTFVNSTMACQACIEYFPEKEDGERFHSALYQDRQGGIWPRACRAGMCDFRDPQTDPVGGIIGKGVGPGGKPDGKTCLTRDPVPEYKDCEPIVLASAKSITDVTRYCSYKHQIYIPPPAKNVSYIAGSKGNAWQRIGGVKQQCLKTIETEGAALNDTMSFCDSNLGALSGCCETVFEALTCVAETSNAVGAWGSSKASIFSIFDEESSMMLDSFSRYCVPLCQNTKKEFCEKFPWADTCVSYDTCSDCTGAGGLWCPKLESCHCPGPKPPCIKPPITTPLQCIAKPEKEKSSSLNSNNKKKKVAAGSDSGSSGDSGSEEKALCKYHEFALKWNKK